MTVETDMVDALVVRFNLFATAESIDTDIQVQYPGATLKPPQADPPISYFELSWVPRPKIHIATHVVRHRGIFGIKVNVPEVDLVDGCNILIDKLYNHFWPTDNSGLWLFRNSKTIRIGRGEDTIVSPIDTTTAYNIGGFITRTAKIFHFCDT